MNNEKLDMCDKFRKCVVEYSDDDETIVHVSMWSSVLESFCLSEVVFFVVLSLIVFIYNLTIIAPDKILFLIVFTHKHTSKTGILR